MSRKGDFDSWRSRYDEMSYQEMAAFYDRVGIEHPRQVHFDTWAFLRFFKFAAANVPGLRVFEVGGWRGELATIMLRRYGEIGWWINFEISRPAVDSSVCLDSRFSALAGDDFVWRMELPPADVFVSSHTIEHIRARDLDTLLARLPETIRYVALQAPLAESALDQDWSGYYGSHILEIGWQQVAEMMQARGFGPAEHLCRGEFRAFIRLEQ